MPDLGKCARHKQINTSKQICLRTLKVPSGNTSPQSHLSSLSHLSLSPLQTCSLEVNCESIAAMGATLANGGECPTTGEKVLHPEAVRDVLSLMHSCGMYNYSGQFAFNVSMPDQCYCQREI